MEQGILLALTINDVLPTVLTLLFIYRYIFILYTLYILYLYILLYIYIGIYIIFLQNFKVPSETDPPCIKLHRNKW